MKKRSTHQEILLFTETCFARCRFINPDERMTPADISTKECLEEACWNGLLPVLLPEITQCTACANHLFLWRISHGNSFLHIELAVAPVLLQAAYAIDPELFLPAKNCN